ncbi:SIMPL domain-containing protein [Fulvivirga ligni]|uniref:SIMPL domain-containing protein n=1 Tax=Fulvivirga ligni TaxID=2904246 RepID=UPI001F21BC4F|nr:SIMPL domain-containing protein [Fulvivirga ligni]UII19906.1 SIMPL domain-containing protein [Fulvivirga ligni]
MKRLSTIAFLFIITLSASAQQLVSSTNPLIKKIEVTGSAEREIIPDEIYLKVALKEYKDGSKIVHMDKLESQLVKAIKEVGIKAEDLQVDNIYGYNWNYRKNKADEFLATKSFIIKMNNVKMINNLVEKLDPEGINSMNIDRLSHSKIEEYRMELKLKALQAAKDKAKFMLEGIGEQLGQALEINEIEQNYAAPMYRSVSNVAMEAAPSYQSDLDVKTIKIKSEMRAVFEIK